VRVEGGGADLIDDLVEVIDVLAAIRAAVVGDAASRWVRAPQTDREEPLDAAGDG